MKKKKTPEEIYELVASCVKNGGRLAQIADENGNLLNGLRVARLDTGEGKVVLKIGTPDEICKAFGIERPLDDSFIEHLIRVKMRCGEAFTIKDKLEDSLTDENVLLL
ncbi:MAG: hypothetical protein IKR25_13755 [Muribaculaceae bacterium]|nr:hypothetical protein [Muribaculaceae bacterium]